MHQIAILALLLADTATNLPPEPYTLVVVDMQWAGDGLAGAAEARVRSAVIAEIERARADGAGIVDLTSLAYALPDPAVHAALAGYSRVSYAKKYDWEGGFAVAMAMVTHNVDHVRMVGVNYDLCILSVVRGLTASLPGTDVSVVGPATDTFTGQTREDGYRALRSVHGVHVEE